MGISGFALGDTIDMPGIAVTSWAFASNALVLNGSAGKQETLDIQGNFSTSNFNVFSDGGGGSDVTLQMPPTIAAGATVIFNGGGAPVALDSGLTVTDPNSPALVSGAISINTGFLTGDALNFSTQNGITGSYNGVTGTLMLSGTASIANYQTALDSIVYGFTAGGDPTGGGSDTSRAITWILTDGVASSNTGGSTLTTVHVAPTIVTGGTVTFAGGGSAVTLDPTLSMSDPDSGGDLTGAMVSVGTGFMSGDTLNFINQNGIAGGFNGATGTLTLTGTSTIANYQAALASINFSSTAADPTSGGTDNNRTVRWTVGEDVSTSASGGSTVNVTRLPPVITGTGKQNTTDESPLDPFASTTIDDPNSGQAETVTVTLSNTSDGTLSNPGSGTISGGGYVVSGSTLAVTSALRGLVFTPAAHRVAPDGTVATGFTIAVTDSNGVTSTDTTIVLTATAAHDAPVITGTAGTRQTSDASTIQPFSGIAISDLDFGQTETVTVIVRNVANGTLSNLGGGALNNGTYTVIGSDAAVSTAVGGLAFTPAAHQVAPGQTVTTDISIAVTDTAGDTAGDNGTNVVSTATHNPPIIGGTKAGQTLNDAQTLSPFASATISDLDFGQTETLTATLSSPANGVLTNLGTGAYDTNTGVYSVTGTVSQVAQSLRSLVFAPTPHQVVPGGAVSTNFTIAVTDTAGDHASDAFTAVVTTAQTDPPVITGAQSGQPVSDEATIAPFAGITIGDVDSGQTETVTVTLSSLANGTLTNLGGGAYDPTIGVYTIIGTDAAVTQSLRGLVFGPTTHQISPGGTVTTAFTLKVTDTAGATTTASTISTTATAANDPPTISQTKVNLGSPNQDIQTPFADLVIADPGVGHIDTVSVTPSDPAVGTLSNSSGGSVDTKTGIYTVTGMASQVTAALKQLVFTPNPPASGYIATTSFEVVATGQGGVASDDTIKAASVTQVLGLAGNPSSQEVISVSTNGTEFAPAAPGKTNQAVVTAPVDKGSYALPDGYQAAFLGGSVDALLNDTSVGGALLIGTPATARSPPPPHVTP